MLKTFGSALFKYVIGPLIGAIVGKALLLALNHFGWRPEDQLAAMFVSAVTPEASYLAGWILAAIVGVFGYSVVYYFLYVKKNDQIAQTVERQQSIPLTAFISLAGNKGWDVDPNSTRDDNNLWIFLTKLRQALSDAVITSKGRSYRAEWMTEDVDDTPLTQIPAEHFHTFSFDVFEIASRDNYQISTRPDSRTTDNPVREQSYIDVQVNKAEAEKWLSGEGKPPVGG